MTAWRNDPAPESLVLRTVNVAAVADRVTAMANSTHAISSRVGRAHNAHFDLLVRPFCETSADVRTKHRP
jgi:hypothetical protein